MLCILVLVPATIAASYYFVFTLLGLKSPSQLPLTHEIHHRIVVLIPAHNEAENIRATLWNLQQNDYPTQAWAICVIADHCSDRTAEIAGECGVRVLIRQDSIQLGKGHALQFGLNEVLKSACDAVLILDADCTTSPSLLARCNDTLIAGAEAAQTPLISRNVDSSVGGYVAAIGSEIDRAVAVGLSRTLGNVPLRGTGMLFHRQLFARLPWNAGGPTEDAEYAARLASERVRVHLIRDAAVYCESPTSEQALLAQRRRWRAAMQVPGTLFIARAIQSKPVVLAQLLVASAIILALSSFTEISNLYATWCLVILGMTSFVYCRAMVRIGIRKHIKNLLLAPQLVARLAWLSLGAWFGQPAKWEQP